jgi:hypothetical protein
LLFLIFAQKPDGIADIEIGIELGFLNASQAQVAEMTKLL